MEFACFCEKRFASEGALAQHAYDKYHEYCCSFCSTMFGTVGRAAAHYRHMHGGITTIVANGHLELDDWMYDSPLVLIQYPCEICGKLLENEQGWYNHRRDVHPACPDCGAFFDTEAGLVDHQMRNGHYRGGWTQSATAPQADMSTWPEAVKSYYEAYQQHYKALHSLPTPTATEETIVTSRPEGGISPQGQTLETTMMPTELSSSPLHLARQSFDANDNSTKIEQSPPISVEKNHTEAQATSAEATSTELTLAAGSSITKQSQSMSNVGKPIWKRLKTSPSYEELQLRLSPGFKMPKPAPSISQTFTESSAKLSPIFTVVEIVPEVMKGSEASSATSFCIARRDSGLAHPASLMVDKSTACDDLPAYLLHKSTDCRDLHTVMVDKSVDVPLLSSLGVKGLSSRPRRPPPPPRPEQTYEEWLCSLIRI